MPKKKKPFVELLVEYMDGKDELYTIGDSPLETHFYTWKIHDGCIKLMGHVTVNRTVIPLCNVRNYRVHKPDNFEMRKDVRNAG